MAEYLLAIAMKSSAVLHPSQKTSRFDSYRFYFSASEMSFPIVSSMFFTYLAAPLIA
jgi:hypothetical protein